MIYEIDYFVNFLYDIYRKLTEVIIMFGGNLRYFRLEKNLTKKELAAKAGVSTALITYYESGERKPTIQSVKSLATALSISPAQLLENRPDIAFSHGAFRKSSSLSKAGQEKVRSTVEDYFSRFYTVLSFFPKDVLSPSPFTPNRNVKLFDDVYDAAKRFRKWLDLPSSGPLPNLTNLLENKGFLLCPITAMEGFSGLNGFVLDRPYIAYNADESSERIRFTLIHELVHLYFGIEDEDEVNGIAGEILFSHEDALRELGPRVKGIAYWMEEVAKEYGISMYSLIYSANQYNIISSSLAKSFYIMAGQRGWKRNEPSRCEKETTTLFEQLVYRAVNNDDISIQRGAELLRLSYREVESRTSAIG